MYPSQFDLGFYHLLSASDASFISHTNSECLKGFLIIMKCIEEKVEYLESYDKRRWIVILA